MNDSSRNKVYTAFAFVASILVLAGGLVAFWPKYKMYRGLKETDAAKAREIEETERQTADRIDRTERFGHNIEEVVDIQQGSGKYKGNVDVIDFSRTKRQ